MAADNVRMPGLLAVGFQTITLNSTAQALNSTIRASARYLELSVETSPARYRVGSTNPTRTTGVYLPTGWYGWEGYNGTSLLKFISANSTAGKLSVQGYSYAGDRTS